MFGSLFLQNLVMEFTALASIASIIAVTQCDIDATTGITQCQKYNDEYDDVLQNVHDFAFLLEEEFLPYTDDASTYTSYGKNFYEQGSGIVLPTTVSKQRVGNSSWSH